MRVHKLTDISISGITPPSSGQVVYRDVGSPLQLRVSAGGSKTFYVVVGQGQRHTIGRYGEVSLAQARDVARRIRAEKTLGRYASNAMPVEQARAEYLSHSTVRPNTRAYYERNLKKLNGKLANIRTGDINRAPDELGTTSRNQALASYRAFFKWCVRRNYLEHSPVEKLILTKSTARSRLLTDNEIRAIWRSTDEPTTFNLIVRLLILTGQRRSEISSIRPEYIKGDLCTLPATLTKNKMEHAFPLGKTSELFPKTTTSAYFFPARGSSTKPFSGWSKGKKELDSRLGGEIAHWTLHDLRRYFASTMARLGVKQEVTERLLNHRSGIISGIAAVYTLHDFMPEMRQAIDLYQEHLANFLKELSVG